MKRLKIKENTTFAEAVKLLDQNGNGFLAVVGDDEVLIGILTDGDVRRAVLEQKTVLLDIINKNPIVRLEHTPKALVYRELKKAKRRHMPLVDENGKFIDVVVLDDFEIHYKPNYVVIMAGGIGSRLGELTKSTPKPMLPVGGKPILHNIINAFKEQGFVNFILCVKYKAEVIKDYFGSGEELNVNIEYTHENKRMGTAGALSLIPEESIKHPFIVVNGDVLTTLSYEDFLDFHIVQKAEATMCVKRFEYQVPYACVDFDEKNNLVGLLEKPIYDYYINAGMYILNPEILKEVPQDTFYDMPTLFEKLIEQKRNIKSFKMDSYWLDIGLPHDYKKVN